MTPREKYLTTRLDRQTALLHSVLVRLHQLERKAGWGNHTAGAFPTECEDPACRNGAELLETHDIVPEDE